MSVNLPSVSVLPAFRTLLAAEFPLRRPQNSFRVHLGRADIRNHFIPDRHEQLNDTATFILELCDGEHSILDIWQALLGEFDVEDADEALCSTVRLIRYLQSTFVVYPCTVEGEQALDATVPIDLKQTSVRI